MAIFFLPYEMRLDFADFLDGLIDDFVAMRENESSVGASAERRHSFDEMGEYDCFSTSHWKRDGLRLDSAFYGLHACFDALRLVRTK